MLLFDHVLGKDKSILHYAARLVDTGGPVVKVCDLEMVKTFVTYIHAGMIVEILLQDLRGQVVETDEIGHLLVFLLKDNGVDCAFSWQEHVAELVLTVLEVDAHILHLLLVKSEDVGEVCFGHQSWLAFDADLI